MILSHITDDQLSTALNVNACFLVITVDHLEQQKVRTRSETTVYTLTVKEVLGGNCNVCTRLKHYGAPLLEVKNDYVIGAILASKDADCLRLLVYQPLAENVKEQQINTLKARISTFNNHG